MIKLKRLAIPVLILCLLFNFTETTAQIQDIKKKSRSNQSKKKSSKSSSSSRSSSSSSSSESDFDTSDALGCLFDAIDLGGCLLSIFSNSGDDDDDYNYSSNNYYEEDYDYDYSKTENENTEEISVEYYENLPLKPVEKKVVDEPIVDTIITIPPTISKTEPEETVLSPEETSYTPNTDFSIQKSTDIEEIKPSLDINGNFAVAFHKGIDRNYTYVNFLPGLRANLGQVKFDFRLNNLTEFTDNTPDALKSWELLFMIDFAKQEELDITVGTGLFRENFSESNFHEWYLGTRFQMSNKKDYIEIDTRFSVDYETDAFPFFEVGGRYNIQFINSEHINAYINLGVMYQNYYQSHDIWGIRGGVIFNWH